LSNKNFGLGTARLIQQTKQLDARKGAQEKPSEEQQDMENNVVFGVKLRGNIKSKSFKPSTSGKRWQTKPLSEFV
jgi:hypothetical protein